MKVSDSQINKMLGYSAIFALAVFILFCYIFLVKSLMTMALLVGLTFNSALAFILSALIMMLAGVFLFRNAKKAITDKSITMPPSEIDTLVRSINNLTNGVKNLADNMKQQQISLNRLVKNLENNTKFGNKCKGKQLTPEQSLDDTDNDNEESPGQTEPQRHHQ